MNGSVNTTGRRQVLLRALPAAILLVLSPYVSAHGTSSRTQVQDVSQAKVCPQPGQPDARCPADSSTSKNAPDQKNVTKLQAIIVTGIRSSITSALALKRSSSGITDSIVAQGIGKLPDDNVANALQRITGVQVSRDASGDATVLIRGLPNIATTFNGRNIFTTTGRSVSLSDIPAGLVKSVTVHKTPDAAEIAGGIGGLVNIQTRRPFDFKKGWTVGGSVRVMHSELSGKNDPQGSLTVNDLWDTSVGRMGLLVAGSYRHHRYEQNNTFNGLYFLVPNPVNPSQKVYEPTDIGAIYTLGDRQRSSGFASFQWQPNSQTRLYAEGYYVHFRDGSQLPFWITLPSQANPFNTTGVTLKPGTNVMKTLTADNLFTLTSNQAFQNQSSTQQVAIGGSWHGDGGVTVKSDLSHTKSTAKGATFIIDSSFIAPRIQFNFANRGAADALVTNADGSPFNLIDSSIYTPYEYFDDWSRQVGKSWAWKNDISIPVDWGPVESVDTGFRLDRRTAYNIGANTGPNMNISGLPLSFTEFPGLAYVTPDNLLKGSGRKLVSTKQWINASRKYMLGHKAQLRQAFGYDPERPREEPSLFFNDTERNYDAYVQANYSGNLGSLPVNGYLGVRLTRLNSRLRGSEIIDGGAAKPVSIDKSVTEALPSFIADISLKDNLLLRLGYGRTLARPAFAALNPELTLNSIAITLAPTGSGGNPDLNAIKSTNYDMSLEWYFQKGSLLSLAGFYRKINGYIETFAANEDINGITYSISRPRNTGTGHLKGVELAYTDFFTSLPGWLSGFGTQLNGTYVSAKTHSPTGQLQDVVNVSKFSYNAILIYQIHNISARLAYNWRSKWASSFNQSGDQPPSIFFGPTHRLDLEINYRINKHLLLMLEGKNLLANTFRDYFSRNIYPFPRDLQQTERTYSLGVRFDF